MTPNELYVISMCAAGQLIVYHGQDMSSLKVTTRLPFGKNLQEAASMSVLNDKSIILACGGYDSAVHIYSLERGKADYLTYMFSLGGHLDSIRDFCFRNEGESLLLASCSQDSYIRLWKIAPLEVDYKSSEEYLKRYESKTSFVLKDVYKEAVYTITLDSVLINHSKAVSSIVWMGNKLLSSSFDFTVAVWDID